MVAASGNGRITSQETKSPPGSEFGMCTSAKTPYALAAKWVALARAFARPSQPTGFRGRAWTMNAQESGDDRDERSVGVATQDEVVESSSRQPEHRQPCDYQGTGADPKCPGQHADTVRSERGRRRDRAPSLSFDYFHCSRPGLGRPRTHAVWRKRGRPSRVPSGQLALP